MIIPKHTNYYRITEIIDYLYTNHKELPNLNAVADKFHLNSSNFNQLFTEWAGVPPHQFIQFTSLKYVKSLLKESHPTLFEIADKIDLSGINVQHNLSIKIDAMSLSELKNGGQPLSINYSFASSPFGKILIATTTKGICHLAFVEDEIEAFSILQKHFPNSNYKQQIDPIQQQAVHFFSLNTPETLPLILHLKGTSFQLKIWENLLKIPLGQLTTYGSIAKHIANPNASRAVGTAIGDNPVAFLIPCHRVIQTTGKLGGYMWGTTRKTLMIAWEAAKINAKK